MLELFMNIDKKATKENVVKLLKLYRRLVRMADEEFLPKMTATYSFEPKGTGGGISDPLGESISNKVAAQEEINRIVKAINKLSSQNRKLLYMKYMKRNVLSDIYIYVDLSMSESTYYRELDRAYIEFSEAYDDGKLMSYLIEL